MEIILASNSPQKISLMKTIFSNFKIIRPKMKEIFNKNFSIKENLKRISYHKAISVLKYCEEKESIIVSSDTVIFFKNTIFGKPESLIEAKETLRMLSGKWHRVLTGYTILLVNGLNKKVLKSFTDISETRVKMRNISIREIDFYLKTGEPLGKAGSYAIQGIGGCFIERIEGDFYTVAGLPISKICEVLYLWGYWPPEK